MFVYNIYMTTEEFNEILKELDYGKQLAADVLGKNLRTIQYYASGSKKNGEKVNIPRSVEKMLRNILTSKRVMQKIRAEVDKSTEPS